MNRIELGLMAGLMVLALTVAWVTATPRSGATPAAENRELSDASITTIDAQGPGAAKGDFDPEMSGVCQFSCATKEAFDEKEIVAQPGAIAGRLTRCPVSGVVFTVAEDRPHIVVAENEYVLCCDNCAKKLTKDPGRYLTL